MSVRKGGTATTIEPTDPSDIRRTKNLRDEPVEQDSQSLI